MIFSENRYPSPIGVEDMLFGITRSLLYGLSMQREIETFAFHFVGDA